MNTYDSAGIVRRASWSLNYGGVTYTEKDYEELCEILRKDGRYATLRLVQKFQGDQ